MIQVFEGSGDMTYGRVVELTCHRLTDKRCDDGQHLILLGFKKSELGRSAAEYSHDEFVEADVIENEAITFHVLEGFQPMGGTKLTIFEGRFKNCETHGEDGPTIYITFVPRFP